MEQQFECGSGDGEFQQQPYWKGAEMIYKNSVMYRGKQKQLKALTPHSTMKVQIVCPDCKTKYNRLFHILARSGNFLCQKCTVNEKLGSRPDIGYSNNKLTLIEHTENFSNSLYRCECGKTKVIENTRVRSGHIQSCGCLKVETMLKAKEAQDHTGEKHPNWKGGVSEESHLLRTSVEYKAWRVKVFERDMYTCKKCYQVGGNLNAHHIEEFANNKDKAYDLDNGITFCDKCHREFHGIYGQTNISIKEVDKFLKQNKRMTDV
ncbi:HNH endonuclease signature motif containing protein [Sulfurovum sp. XTW-4]|uniref:HNH endonuclease signature motif containing protein n=1 Tax=Sulfurovum xiamenensis TaxID=3019066 RepID=A0ABT7QUG4_9BACT|nr:HNH endonuclease signature motif containing protein [Sulfurovum xiamenensis]MDM5264671.1 HNH endonuclease signature motif containing protein [Sulfurovum xiamenensis]